MSDPVVYIDEKKVDYRKAAVSVFDYTVHCGIGMFEAVLAIDDRLILLEEHLNRMEAGIKRLGLKKLNYSRAKIKRVLRRAAAEHPGKIKKTKIILTTGYSPLWPGSRPKSQTIIIVIDHELEFRHQKLLISPMRISTENLLRGTKTLNYLTEWISQSNAEGKGFDQGIIVNQRGQIAETGSANIFMVKNGRVYTPPIDSGCLPGITRAEILRLLAANKIKFYERPIKPEMLAGADEIFISSSFKIIWPVVQLKLDRKYHFKPGPIAKALYDRMTANFLSGRHQDEFERS